MNSDVAFRIGASHTICQDYGRSGKFADGCYAVISDGCSSSPETDIGSRLICLAAEATILEGGELSSHKIASRAHTMLAALAESGHHIHKQAIDATLGVVTARAGKISAYLFGDGFIVAKFKDRMEITQISYASGYPDYPSYTLDPQRRNSVKDKLVGTLSVSLMQDGKLSEVYSCAEWDGPYFLSMDKATGVEYMAVMTDGATSFVHSIETETSKTENPLPLELVLREMLSFKSFQGVFAQRRMHKFERDCHSFKWLHHDDLAIGVACL